MVGLPCKGVGQIKCPMAKASESKCLLHESMCPLQKSKRPRGPGRQYETMIPTCTGTLIKLFHFKQTLWSHSQLIYRCTTQAAGSHQCEIS